MDSAARFTAFTIIYSPFTTLLAMLCSAKRALLEGLNKKDDNYLLFCLAVLSVATRILLISRQSLISESPSASDDLFGDDRFMLFFEKILIELDNA